MRALLTAAIHQMMQEDTYAARIDFKKIFFGLSKIFSLFHFCVQEPCSLDHGIFVDLSLIFSDFPFCVPSLPCAPLCQYIASSSDEQPKPG
jgi:hypothetical protein